MAASMSCAGGWPTTTQAGFSSLLTSYSEALANAYVLTADIVLTAQLGQSQRWYTRT
jgi:hypothetical protein